MIEKLGVFFRDTEAGRRQLAFARDMASKIGCSFSILFPRGGHEAVATPMRLQCFAIDTPSLRFETCVFDHGAFDAQWLFVGNDPPTGAVALRPFDEEVFDRAGTRTILVPFGDGDAGRIAAFHAVQFAKAFGFQVVFYHTTWRNADVSSSDPKDHISEKARLAQTHVEMLARNASATFRTIIETADDVVEGIMLAALTCGAAFIAMAQATEVVQGSYVDQVIELGGPVPILTFVQEVLS